MRRAANLRRASHRARERGAVLIVALLFLVILTMLGMTAVTGSTMEERMAGNTRDSAIALQAAEAALRDARRDIGAVGVNGAAYGRGARINISQFGDGTGANNGSCSSTGLCRPYAYNPGLEALLPAAPAVDMTAAPSVAYGTYTGAPALQLVANQPRYIVEVFCLDYRGNPMGGELPCNFFRITARGYGANPNTVVNLQEVYLSF